MWGTFPDVLDRTITWYKDNIAVVDGDRRITYEEMGSWRNRVAQGLVNDGLTKGERVGMLMPNNLEFIPTQQGIWAAGGVLIQMPVRQTAKSFTKMLTASEATTLIYDGQFDDTAAYLKENVPTLRRMIRLSSSAASAAVPAGIQDYNSLFDSQPDERPDVPLVPDDEAYVLFTSGSTGEPKGSVNTHFTWGYYAITSGLEIGETAWNEVFAHGAPLTHYTQIFVIPTFLRGGTNVMMSGLDLETLLATIQREKVTATAVVPTIIYMLLNYPDREKYDISSLETMIYAGAPISADQLKRALEVFGPIFIQTYAGTEPGYVASLRKHEHRVDSPEWIARLASAGRPLPFVSVTIQDDDDNALPVGEVGEITTRQTGQMITYVDPLRNEETLRDGEVHTGDVGRLDEDGYLYILDRKKDMVVSGGFNVFPRQVEDVLVRHPQVVTAAVIGIPHEKWGEAVHATIVLTDDATVDEDELKALVKDELGGVPVPKTFEFVETLPTNPAGKIDKKRLREPFWAGQSREVS